MNTTKVPSEEFLFELNSPWQYYAKEDVLHLLDLKGTIITHFKSGSRFEFNKNSFYSFLRYSLLQNTDNLLWDRINKIFEKYDLRSIYLHFYNKKTKKEAPFYFLISVSIVDNNTGRIQIMCALTSKNLPKKNKMFSGMWHITSFMELIQEKQIKAPQYVSMVKKLIPLVKYFTVIHNANFPYKFIEHFLQKLSTDSFYRPFIKNKNIIIEPRRLK